MSNKNTILVGDWQIKLDGLTIQNKHQNKELDSKVMQLLVYLVTNRERVVSRNELLDQLWKNKVVADDVLNVAISSLRKALGDDFKTPVYIKTLPRKGYQLIAPVSTMPSYSSSIKRNWIIAAFLLTFVFLLWSLLPLFNTHFDSNKAPRLAVLPFDYYSSVKDREYVADGFTEAIINRLVQESELQVTSRSSVMKYKKQKVSIKEIVAQLNVEWVLEGSVQLEGDKILVTAQLINAVDDVHVWSETYQRKSGDLLDIQAEIAKEIVVTLNLPTKSTSLNNVIPDVTQIPAVAYDSFMRGQYYYYKGEVDRAINAFQQAIDVYPDYGEAYAHLSHAYFYGYFTQYNSATEPTGDFIDRASKLAVKSLQLDPNTPYAQLAIALKYLYKDYDYQAAGRAFERAFEGNNHDLMILEWYIEYSLITKQFDKAEHLAKHMVKVSPLAYNKIRLYQVLYYRGNFKGAESEVANKAAVFSASYRESLYIWNALASDDDEALLNHVPIFLKELNIKKHIIDKFKALLKNNDRKSALNLIVEKTTTFNNYEKAKIYAYAGETDKAILLLNTLVEARNLDVLKLAIEPSFKQLINEPSYAALLKKLKLI